MKSFVESSHFFGKENPELLAQKYDTPLYVYNEESLREHMRAVANVITKYPYRANYSMKANSNLSILKIALEEGLNADAMSVGEMMLLIKAGFPSDRIFFVPNNVSEEELRFAIDHDIMTSLDSLEQLELFGSINPGGKCSVRINPGVGAGHHEKVVTAGKKTKFGIEEHDVDAIFDIAKKYNLHIAEINQHVGSQYLDPQPFLDAVENFLRIAEKLSTSTSAVATEFPTTNLTMRRNSTWRASPQDLRRFLMRMPQSIRTIFLCSKANPDVTALRKAA